MDRNKTIAIVVGALAALAAITIGLQSVEAATWHDYKGDIYAGHAYGLLVPPNAKNYEINLAGGPNASAKLAIFDPAGAKLGYYDLSSALTSASIGGPAQGRHVLYVYDIAGDGALTLRVNSDTAPPTDLQQIPLVRNDISLASQDAAAKLDKTMSAKLENAPVFVTLLYDGSAQDLTATVASAKGDVVTITHESGTAFSPGVWTSQSGQRTSTPANLDGIAYTVTAHAEKFQGDMILTTLSLDLKAPEQAAKTPGAPDVKSPKMHMPAPGSFAINRGKAVAFAADKGTLILEDPQAHHAKNQSSYVSDVISIYAPDDKLVQVVTLSEDNATASVELVTAGEYVVYVHAASNKVVIAHLEGSKAAPEVRELKLAKEKVDLKSTEGASTFTLKNTPIELMLNTASDSTGVLDSASIKNEKGIVAEANDVASLGGAQMFMWTDVHRENFQAGEHTLSMSGIMPAHYELTSTYFVRAAEAKATTPAPEEPASESPEAPPTPPTPPEPPAPQAPSAPQVPRVLALPPLPAMPPL